MSSDRVDAERGQQAVDAILATPVSQDAMTMMVFLGKCEDDGIRPNINALGWDRHRAELALIELKVRGFIQNEDGPS